MKAAVVHEFSKPLVIEEVPKPVAGSGEVVVRIETSGLCHTDIHAAHGDWPVKPKPPFIPGHEGVGIVESLGAGVTEVAVGDRVALPWLGFACGTCGYCTNGWETLCEQQRNTGYSVDGGYAEYAAATAKYVAKVPAGVNPLDAAPLTCAGVTTYKAVKLSGARPASLVAVFGIGGLGHLALQYAKVFGASVVAIDVVDDKLRLARNWARTTPSTRSPRIRFRRSKTSAAPMPQSRWRSRRRRSSRRTGRYAAAASWSSSPCPRITQSSCRSSRPSSTESRSLAQSWAPARSSMRCFGCTLKGAPGWSARSASWTRSTSVSKTSRRARCRPGSSLTCVESVMAAAVCSRRHDGGGVITVVQRQSWND